MTALAAVNSGAYLDAAGNLRPFSCVGHWGEIPC